MHFIFIYSEINSKAHLMRKPNDGSVNTNVLAYQIISQNLKVYILQKTIGHLTCSKLKHHSDLYFLYIPSKLGVSNCILSFRVFVAELLLPARHF